MSRPFFHAFIVVSLTTLLLGCGPAANEVQPDKALKLGSHGAIAVSLTSRGIPFLHALDFYYVAEKGGEEQRINAYSTSSDGYWSDYYQDIDKGRLAILELPPGNYRFNSWNAGAGGVGGTRSISPVEPVSVPFSVAAGKVTYLGNLHLRSQDVDDVVSSHAKSQHQLLVRDKSAQDLPVIKQRLGAHSKALLMRLMQPAKGASSGEHNTYEPFVDPQFKRLR